MMKRQKKSAQAWIEKTNPLLGTSIRDMQNIFDAARNGNTQRLHWLFQEIEAANPLLLVCVERRAAAVANFRWRITERAALDGKLSEEQRDAAQIFFNNIENFSEAMEHLDLAFFRGFAHVQPIWEDDATVKEIALLDSWKFLRHPGQEWLYNPACTGFGPDAESCDGARLMTIERNRPIDYPALGVHVRHAVGNGDWGRFVERYALPKPAVFMHPGATNEQRADYLQGAEAVENGQVSVWPNGATLTDFAGGSRGTDPFKSFIEQQERTVVLLATGGTLMSLAEAGTGTLAGNAQADVWTSIVRRDAGVLERAVKKSLLRPFLEAHFPGKPITVDFSFDFTEEPTPKEIFELAALAKQAGYSIDQHELEEKTGYTLQKESAMATSPVPFMNKEQPQPKDESSEEWTPPEPQGESIVDAFARDASPVGERLRFLMEDPTQKALDEFIEDLPDLMPNEPEMAAVLAEEMAKEFAKAAQPASKSNSIGSKSRGAIQTDK